MGCCSSRFDDIEVTGLSTRLEVLPSGSEYVRKGVTQLQLKGKSLFTKGGVIEDFVKNKWFDVDAKEGEAVVTNAHDVPIAEFKLQRMSSGDGAHIFAEKGGHTLVFATIKRREGFDIFIHKPPILLDQVHTNKLIEGKQDIFVDTSGRAENFIMGDVVNDPIIVAKVESGLFTDDAAIKVGANVDISFICICYLAIKEILNKEAYLVAMISQIASS